MVKSDIIRTKVDRHHKRGHAGQEAVPVDGSVEITVVMRMKGDFLNAVVPEAFGGTMLQPPPVPLKAGARAIHSG